MATKVVDRVKRKLFAAANNGHALQTERCYSPVTTRQQI